MKLNKFYGNINWEMEIHNQNIKHVRMLCEIYKEGVNTWIPLAEKVRNERNMV